MREGERQHIVQSLALLLERSSQLETYAHMFVHHWLLCFRWRITGFTPLLIAACEGHLRTCQLLLRAGANPNQATPDGSASLLLAAQAGNAPLVHTLLHAGEYVL